MGAFDEMDGFDGLDGFDGFDGLDGLDGFCELDMGGFFRMGEMGMLVPVLFGVGDRLSLIARTSTLSVHGSFLIYAIYFCMAISVLTHACSRAWSGCSRSFINLSKAFVTSPCSSKKLLDLK